MNIYIYIYIYIYDIGHERSDSDEFFARGNSLDSKHSGQDLTRGAENCG